MIRCPVWNFKRWQQSQTKYRSFYGTMTVRQALAHLQEWPPFDGPVELDEAIRRAWNNGQAEDHTALCALMQSGHWRDL